jgi:hypothetical protein
VGGGICIGEDEAGAACGAMGTHDQPIGMMRLTGRRLIAVVSTEATAVRVEIPHQRPLTPRLFRPQELESVVVAVVLPKRPSAVTVIAMQGQEELGRETFELPANP